MHNGIFDGTLTAGAIGGEPYCEFSSPIASALKPFSNPHSYCVLLDPIHWVTEPAPLDEDHNILFFTGNLCYSGTIALSTIFWIFMTIYRGKWGKVRHLFSWLRERATMKIELYLFINLDCESLIFCEQIQLLRNMAGLTPPTRKFGKWTKYRKHAAL